MNDGPRSTFFEYDLQLFFVTYGVYGTDIRDVELYSPSFGLTTGGDFVAVRGANNSLGLPMMEFKPLTGILNSSPDKFLSWTPRYDPNIVKAFIEKYTPKAVMRRMQ